MMPAKRKMPRPLSHMATVLLDELREECKIAIALIDRLKKRGALTSSRQADILGELSASILHLHIHTDGLDDVVIEADAPPVTKHASKSLPSARARVGTAHGLGHRRAAATR